MDNTIQNNLLNNNYNSYSNNINGLNKDKTGLATPKINKNKDTTNIT